jgi:adenylate kinase
MEAIILLGAPGAGKGTVAERLKQSTGLTHLSTGDMLREAVAAGSPVGERAKGYMERGELVPDETILEIVGERMDRDGPEARYLLDGFPRTTRQAELLDGELQGRDGRLLRVFLLEVPREVLMERLTGRRVCRSCGAVYHVRNIPPKAEGVCDVCGGELYQRPDDREETVRNRLDVYEKQTAELIDYYERRGKLARIDASRDPETTAGAIRTDLRE